MIELRIKIQSSETGFIGDVRGENSATKKIQYESWYVTDRDVPKDKQLEAMIAGMPIIVQKVVNAIQ